MPLWLMRPGMERQNSWRCVRYVSVEGAIKERFLALTQVSQFDATSITAAIANQLVKKGIDHLKYVAQTYDGAAVMSGDFGGVQAHLKKSTLRQFMWIVMHMS